MDDETRIGQLIGGPFHGQRRANNLPVLEITKPKPIVLHEDGYSYPAEMSYTLGRYEWIGLTQQWIWMGWDDESG